MISYIKIYKTQQTQSRTNSTSFQDILTNSRLSVTLLILYRFITVPGDMTVDNNKIAALKQGSPYTLISKSFFQGENIIFCAFCNKRVLFGKSVIIVP